MALTRWGMAKRKWCGRCPALQLRQARGDAVEHWPIENTSIGACLTKTAL
jgi:hypothetical protein